MNLHFLFALITAFTGSAQATSFYIRPFSEFTQSTPNIIRGTLREQKVENALTPEGGRTIYTFARVDVKEVLKGGIQKSEIQIRKVGGSKDGYTLEIPSSPEFKEGEENVLFLSEEKEDQSYEVVGLELGKFDLEAKGDDVLLKGGLFNFSRPNPSEHHENADHQGENKRSWSTRDLKELLQKQGVPPSKLLTQAPSPAVTTSESPATAPSSSPPSLAASAPPTTEDTSTHELLDHSAKTTYWIPFGLALASLFIALFVYLRRR